MATIDAGISNLKVKKLASGNIALVCSALATPEGKLANPEAEPKPLSSAKVYTRLFARHWDTWNTENQSSLLYIALEKKDGKYLIAGPGLVNALAGTELPSFFSRAVYQRELWFSVFQVSQWRANSLV